MKRFASQQTGSYIAIPVDVIEKVLLNMQVCSHMTSLDDFILVLELLGFIMHIVARIVSCRSRHRLFLLWISSIV